MKWTEDQQKAIEARKGTLLVSAAAGSGKTAVLVERVIQRLCDSEDPLVNDADSVSKADLAFYATDSFTRFYAIARNLGTRSLNIDNNSVFFFGKLKSQQV